ncbi:alpha/beta fold hydrolase [Galbibacter pacificus]|uniref:Alpha/beta hydrolase n=1 Tax=Galbibacter pacificus TaxID=2996052 RepID=A0ABT6FTC4_9FLAO|nr:alpha/beta hydrolase [Galbibacter pacificus]MDG3583024.1 alpha/beta hydrolase [Galbibacter pacificus]MDG3586505.1 alpha/beta hydrolase [Galbibacter pacificus]
MKTKYASKKTNSFGHTVQINDFEMYYEEYGDGKPLVLLHGFGGCSQNWHPFISKLSENYRLIVIDMRGHGYSTNPVNKFTHQDSANDVFFLLDKLGIDSFSAMGMSSGGMTLLHMAINQPKRIDSMILISATSYFPEQARAIMRRASFETLPQEVREMYRECAKRGDEQIRQLIAQFNALGENYDDMSLTEQDLSAITAQTLIVQGDCDNFFPIEISESMKRFIPNSELWIISGGEHVPIYDAKIPFTSKALKFLGGIDNKTQSDRYLKK